MHYIIHINPFEPNGIFHKAIYKNIRMVNVYIQGSQVIFTKQHSIFPLKIHSVSENSADPYEISHYVAFNLGLHCLPKYLFRGSRSSKGLIIK